MLIERLTGKPTSRPPVWLMRQAGRYLPEFRKLRAQYDFVTLCQTPELAAEVTMMPLKRYPLDAAILFSDILVVCQLFDRPFSIEEKVGPVIDNPIRSLEELQQAYTVRDRLRYVADAIELLKSRLEVPLLGFCGGPLTVASYLIEGGSSKDHAHVKQWMYENPSSFASLLEQITTQTIDYLQMQVEAGVDAVQLFESWAAIAPIPQFKELVLPQVQRVVDAVRDVPVILFAKGGTGYSRLLADLRPAAVSVDSGVDLPVFAREVPQGVAVQGNLDPDLLFCSREVVEREVAGLLDQMRDCPNFIFNLGHGLKPGTPEENVGALVQMVTQYQQNEVTA